MGVVNASVDHALANGWSVGLAVWNLFGQYAAARTTYCVAQWDHVSLGATLGCGYTHATGLFETTDSRVPVRDRLPATNYSYTWLMPAAVMSLSLFPLHSDKDVTLRGVLGPSFRVTAAQGARAELAPLLDLTINIELALRYKCCELCLGLPDLIGVRYSW